MRFPWMIGSLCKPSHVGDYPKGSFLMLRSITGGIGGPIELEVAIDIA